MADSKAYLILKAISDKIDTDKLVVNTVTIDYPTLQDLATLAENDPTKFPYCICYIGESEVRDNLNRPISKMQTLLPIGIDVWVKPVTNFYQELDSAIKDVRDIIELKTNKHWTADVSYQEDLREVARLISYDPNNPDIIRLGFAMIDFRVSYQYTEGNS